MHYVEKSYLEDGGLVSGRYKPLCLHMTNLRNYFLLAIM